MFETDEQGKWEVMEGKACKVRLLVEPSQSFLDWQASNPIAEEPELFNAEAEIDSLKARVGKLEKR